MILVSVVWLIGLVKGTQLMATILHVFYKSAHYGPMEEVHALYLSPCGIPGSVRTSRNRQLLILPSSVLKEFGLKAGDLRENVVIDDDGIGPLHTIPSGTVISLGTTLIRLTKHCEPCTRIKHLVDLNAIRGKRGYLATVLDTGTIRVGDVASIYRVCTDPQPLIRRLFARF
jgi:hypothetical protein